MINELNFSQYQGIVSGQPEMQEVKGGKKLLKFRLAYITPFTTDSEGSHTNFISVEAWGKVAEAFEPILQDGLEIVVYGQIVQNRFQGKNGDQVSLFRFQAISLSIVDLKFKGSAAQAA